MNDLIEFIIFSIFGALIYYSAYRQGYNYAKDKYERRDK